MTAIPFVQLHFYLAKNVKCTEIYGFTGGLQWSFTASNTFKTTFPHPIPDRMLPAFWGKSNGSPCSSGRNYSYWGKIASGLGYPYVMGDNRTLFSRVHTKTVHLRSDDLFIFFSVCFQICVLLVCECTCVCCEWL